MLQAETKSISKGRQKESRKSNLDSVHADNRQTSRRYRWQAGRKLRLLYTWGKKGWVKILVHILFVLE